MLVRLCQGKLPITQARPADLRPPAARSEQRVSESIVGIPASYSIVIQPLDEFLKGAENGIQDTAFRPGATVSSHGYDSRVFARRCARGHR